MKVLITGGCGFLGSNLAASALSRGHELCILDNLSRQGSIDNLAWLRTAGRFRFAHADIRNGVDVEAVFSSFEPDLVFHLAGQVAMTTSIANPRHDFEVNALGTLNVLEALRRISPAASLIYSSTNKVYGDLEQFSYSEMPSRYVCLERPDGFDESVPLDFHSPYGCSKGSADQYILDYGRIYGLRTVVLRHSSMYGGRQFSTVDQGWVGWFCQMAADVRSGRRLGPIDIAGNGKQVRDVLHADDMVALYFRLAARLDVCAGRAFNVGGGMANSLSLLELLGLLSTLVGRPLDPASGPARQSDQRIFVADTRRLRETIGWEPRVRSVDGIESMLRWVESVSHQAPA